MNDLRLYMYVYISIYLWDNQDPKAENCATSVVQCATSPFTCMFLKRCFPFGALCTDFYRTISIQPDNGNNPCSFLLNRNSQFTYLVYPLYISSLLRWSQFWNLIVLVVFFINHLILYIHTHVYVNIINQFFVAVPRPNQSVKREKRVHFGAYVIKLVAMIR